MHKTVEKSEKCKFSPTVHHHFVLHNQLTVFEYRKKVFLLYKVDKNSSKTLKKKFMVTFNSSKIDEKCQNATF